MPAASWSKREEKALKKLWKKYYEGVVTKDQICKVFNRTWSAIGTKASRLGLTPTEEQMDYDYYKKICKVLKI